MLIRHPLLLDEDETALVHHDGLRMGRTAVGFQLDVENATCRVKVKQLPKFGLQRTAKLAHALGIVLHNGHLKLAPTANGRFNVHSALLLSTTQ